MKEAFLEWLQQSPWLVALAALMLVTHILSPTEGIGALYGDLITDDYHVRRKYRSHHRHSYSSYDFSSRYRLEIRGIRGQFPIDSADYEALNHPPLPRIRVEYWPKSGIIRRLTINPTEESP